MNTIVVKRKGTIWFNDYYEVDEITEKTIQDCIDDNYANFIESIPEWETWEPTGDIEVINEDNGDILFDSETSQVIVPKNEKD